MADTAHVEDAHSKLGPSAAERWIECAVSVIRAAKYENKSSVFAKEGTGAHAVCEHCLKTGVSPRSLRGGVVVNEGDKKGVYAKKRGNPQPDNDNVWTINLDMVAAVEMYVETIQSIMARCVDPVILVEQKVNVANVHPLLWGTADCIIYDRATQDLYVVDFKYGSGIAVEAAWNPQLLCYALGAARVYGYQVERVGIVVVQPRAHHPEGEVRWFHLDIVDLLIYEAWLKTMAARIDQDTAAKVGPWCRFCPAAARCDDLRDYVFSILKVKVMASGAIKLPRVEELSSKELGRVFKNATIIQIWMNRFFEYAHDQALNGKMPEGCKLVESKSYRKWKDPEAVKDEFEAMGIPEEDYLTEQALLGPGSVEKAVGKKMFREMFADMAFKPKGQTTLALLEDRRPEVKVGKGAAFGAVEDEDDD